MDLPEWECNAVATLALNSEQGIYLLNKGSNFMFTKNSGRVCAQRGTSDWGTCVTKYCNKCNLWV